MRNKQNILFIICLLFLLFLNSCGQARSGEKKKEINASEIIKLINKGKSVQFTDKIIMDDLDFSEIKEEYISSPTTIQKPVRSNVFFIGCVFMGNVTTNGTFKKMQKNVLFENNVTFFDCDFRKKLNFNNTVIRGQLNFAKSVFRGEASFNGILVLGYKNSFWEIEAESSFDMIQADIRGEMNYMDAKFEKDVSFQSLSVKGVQFNNVVFDGKLDFSNTIIQGNSFFNYTQFSEKTEFSFSKFFGNTDFLHAKFQKQIDFSESVFYGKTRFNDSGFPEETIFSGAVFIQNPQMYRIVSPKEISVTAIDNKEILYK